VGVEESAAENEHRPGSLNAKRSLMSRAIYCGRLFETTK